jgi:hypothetical protein
LGKQSRPGLVEFDGETRGKNKANGIKMIYVTEKKTRQEKVGLLTQIRHFVIRAYVMSM